MSQELEEALKRLQNENRQYLDLINEIKLIINLEKEYDGLSILGGLKKVMKDLIQLKLENIELKKKIKKLEK